MSHFPAHGTDVHSAGGGVGVAKLPGTHVHLPSAFRSQCPSKSGQSAPGGQRWITQRPSQAAESHSLDIVGTGVGVVTFTGTQLQLPAASSSHWPSRAGTSGHEEALGHGNEITQEPPHIALLHWPPVGVGVGVDRLTGTQSQLPAVLSSH